jgi:hydrogenase maturation factor HypF (carbamoyltransferase family)
MLDPELEVPCPGCGRKFKQRLSGLNHHHRIACPHCGKAIEISGDGADKAQAELKKLEDMFKKLGR